MMKVQGGVLRSLASDVAASVVPAPADDAFGDALKAIFQWTGVGAVCAGLLGIVAACLWSGIAGILNRGARWSVVLSGLVVLFVVLASTMTSACVKAMSRVNTNTVLDYLGVSVILAVPLVAAFLGTAFGRHLKVPVRY